MIFGPEQLSKVIENEIDIRVQYINVNGSCNGTEKNGVVNLSTPSVIRVHPQKSYISNNSQCYR